jgi:hypothetical protein
VLRVGGDGLVLICHAGTRFSDSVDDDGGCLIGWRHIRRGRRFVAFPLSTATAGGEGERK